MNNLEAIKIHLRVDSKEWSLSQYVMLCIKGSAIGVIDNKQITLQKNDVLYKTKVTTVTISSVSDNAEFIQLIPNNDFNGFFQGIIPISTKLQAFNNPVIHLNSSDAHTIQQDAKQLFYIQEKLEKESSLAKQDILRKQYGLLCVYVCLDVLSFMVGNEQKQKSQTTLLAKFVKLIYAHCSEQRDVSFYAQNMCLSVSYFSHKIQEETGHTPKYWIDKILTEQINSEFSNNTPISKVVEKYHFTDAIQLQRYLKRTTKQCL